MLVAGPNWQAKIGERRAIPGEAEKLFSLRFRREWQLLLKNVMTDSTAQPSLLESGTKAAANPRSDRIRWFSEISIDDIPLVGGKNASLGEMYQQLTPKGIRVPEGFAVTSEGYWDFLREAGLDKEIAKLLQELETSRIWPRFVRADPNCVDPFLRFLCLRNWKRRFWMPITS